MIIRLHFSEGVRKNQRMSQPALFSISGMRDRTKAKNHSPSRDAFRRDHEIRRAWGLQRRHAEKLRRIHERDSMPLFQEDREWLASLAPQPRPTPAPPQTPPTPQLPAPAPRPAPAPTPVQPLSVPPASDAAGAQPTPTTPASPSPLGASIRRSASTDQRTGPTLIPIDHQLVMPLFQSSRGGLLLNYHGAGRAPVTVTLGVLPDDRVSGGHRAMAEEYPCRTSSDSLCFAWGSPRIILPKEIGHRGRRREVGSVRAIGTSAVPGQASRIHLVAPVRKIVIAIAMGSGNTYGRTQTRTHRHRATGHRATASRAQRSRLSAHRPHPTHQPQPPMIGSEEDNRPGQRPRRATRAARLGGSRVG
ncbi:hypothetical protein SAMN04489716_2962 [Actinoplanes derwentensis]|uniref:Uncharacterized protein n=1 Tax=Actinoplanes derwentensis TaxID=113562 RepID=A0A1H1YR73_9ACTN|nr:hypothetical protein SAMN04489716_2962 [Actinoplanes derwentensis]